MQYQRKNVGSMREEYPFKDNPTALTLTNEIKRLAEIREVKMDAMMNELAGVLEVSDRQIYNYRMGKTQIPDDAVLIFCREFRSTAMVAAWLREQNLLDELENFDIVRLANQTARQTLQTHDRFLEAFEDGRIDGFELSDLRSETAKSVASFNRLEQVAEDAYNRRRAA